MILFVDDEHRHIKTYLAELEAEGYEVCLITDVDEALSFFEERLANIDLLILDIMMPPGLSFKDTYTKFGLETGVSFYERIRRQAPNLRVIILTNVSDEQMAKRFGGEHNCWFVKKVDCLPYELVEKIREALSPVF